MFPLIADFLSLLSAAIHIISHDAFLCSTLLSWVLCEFGVRRGVFGRTLAGGRYYWSGWAFFVSTSISFLSRSRSFADQWSAIIGSSACWLRDSFDGSLSMGCAVLSRITSPWLRVSASQEARSSLGYDDTHTGSCTRASQQGQFPE